MLNKLDYLQLFAEGEGGAEGAPEATTGEEVPAGIPDRAKEMYRKAVAKSGKAMQNDTKAQEEPDKAEPEKPAHVAYTDLIKSDEYKDEHKAYMDKTIGERLKSVKGENGKMKALLETVASKYGLDPASDTFLDDLTSKIDDDDSYYEEYAMENDMTTEQAKHVVNLERQVQAMQAMQEESMRQERMAQYRDTVFQNASNTKKLYPSFDLMAEMQDEKFRNTLAVMDGDTTAAYAAIHYAEIQAETARQASQQAQVKVAQSVASNQSRPSEGGISSQAGSVIKTDYSKMTLDQIRKQADIWRRGGR